MELSAATKSSKTSWSKIQSYSLTLWLRGHPVRTLCLYCVHCHDCLAILLNMKTLTIKPYPLAISLILSPNNLVDMVV